MKRNDRSESTGLSPEAEVMVMPPQGRNSGASGKPKVEGSILGSGVRCMRCRLGDRAFQSPPGRAGL